MEAANVDRRAPKSPCVSIQEDDDSGDGDDDGNDTVHPQTCSGHFGIGFRLKIGSNRQTRES